MFVSVSRASPRSVFITCDRRPVRLSNMEIHLYAHGQGPGLTGVKSAGKPMLNSIFYPITSLMYAALAAYFWRAHWLTAPAARAQSRTAEHVMVLLPLALHAMLLYQSVFAGAGVHLGIGNAISTIVWLTVAIYWLGNLADQFEGMQAM